jgi:hypothetical protein
LTHGLSTSTKREDAPTGQETIDPNHFGHLRYDIMSEIVMLETRRIEEFLQSFDHYKAIICDDDIIEDDETYCDAEMIYYLNDVETNVVLGPHSAMGHRSPTFATNMVRISIRAFRSHKNPTKT